MTTTLGRTRPAAPAHRPGVGGVPLGRVLAWAAAVAVPLLFLGVFFAWPVAAIVGRGFVTDGALDLGGFADVLSRPRTWRIVGQTLTQATLGTLGAVLLGVPGAYLLHRCTFRGRGALRAFVTVPFVLPTVVVGVAFRSLLVEGGLLGGLGLDGTRTAIVLALVFFNYAVVVRTVGGLWERLDPRAEQAARSLGASPWRAFRTVTLPALAPAIASAASLTFLFCATAFGTVLVLGGRQFGTVETEIWVQTTQFLDLRAAAVLSVVQLVVVVAALALAGRARARTERALALTEPVDAAHPVRLRDPLDRVAVVVTAVTALGLLALPLVNLVVRSLRTPDGWGLANYARLAQPADVLRVSPWEATVTSLRVALDATVLALVVGGLVALVVSRRPRRTAGRRAVAGLDALFMLPLGVSAVTVGFGFLVSMDRPFGLPLDLRTSGVLVPVAQAVVAVPLVVRTVLPVLRAIDPRLREAAATLGASPGRVLRTVDLAVAVRSVGLALGFAFAASLGEFGATSFLARPEDPTLPVVIFRLLGRPGVDNYGTALAASVLLAALTAGIVAVCERLRPPGVGSSW
ncbi:ABC transporter permease [Cellulomonas shaoxiangyii]|uniref:Iron ABC transporter permease n=1 Tax=Cellulomonas shaoxiangyii TaxID=2566013 RepID=A0A4P7SMT5_9CELL|nr:ABC transporter permease subunit [Cellulomonas shaoxiangyii]QCB94837.1 iron ABC transporter permease [Cellulomonas shaoxiangyii]TGY86568.1 iron ABC transporter permease [Cellulomonas shaoxiangyii]